MPLSCSGYSGSHWHTARIPFSSSAQSIPSIASTLADSRRRAAVASSSIGMERPACA